MFSLHYVYYISPLQQPTGSPSISGVVRLLLSRALLLLRATILNTFLLLPVVAVSITSMLTYEHGQHGIDVQVEQLHTEIGRHSI
ncbi:hypothetical protein KR51_00024580 [Rubidibacter lacunae KORDI 51-2]|uniref:Uncharacterized protein n=1 Tax=Rubidibacter lacunae KORDI 51-2 TaxID=582515 RepID=U5DK50_9CHRO|nr:hypothetical protein KR51_00024580 [Rubidibacter lacunae KORDI 51-2]